MDLQMMTLGAMVYPDSGSRGISPDLSWVWVTGVGTAMSLRMLFKIIYEFNYSITFM